MTINIFEGGRRIAKIAAAIWVIFWISLSIYIFIDGANIKDITLILLASMIFGGPLFILALTWAIGWIVRGFMGIPKGQDKK